MVQPHTKCRACGAERLEPYLDLGVQAPANALRRPEDQTPEFRAPLSVSWCATCGLSQLDQVVSPDILYAAYPFRAGVSGLWRAHCADLLQIVAGPGRRALLDIGVSGPLVGFAIAIPVTLAGLALSTASTALPPNAVGEAIRPSILFSFLSLFFPLPSSFSLHPLAFAGWVGLFVTAINLLPAGQLDGGHVARALLGRRQFYVSWAAVLVLFGLTFVTTYPGWFIFGFLILMLGVRHPPPLNDLTRLDPARKLVGIVAVAILIVTFVPQPFAPVGTQRDLAFEAVPGFPFPINATIALASSIRLVFALNDTGAAPENVVVNLRENNLNEFGFVIRFTALQIGTATTPVNTDTLTFRLNVSQRAVLDLNVTAPASWGTSSLPATVTFQVHATTPDGAVQEDLLITLQVTS